MRSKRILLIIKSKCLSNVLQLPDHVLKLKGKGKMTEGDARVPPKKVKYLSKFKSGWTEEFPCISNSHLDNSHAFCKACPIDFNIGHGSKNDVRQHVRHYFASFHIAMPP